MKLVRLGCLLTIAFVCSRVQSQTVAASHVANPVDAGAAADASGKSAGHRVKRVLIISIDGLRPDLLLRANMPNVRALCSQGSFTFWAETTPEAYTLPCHVSMLTGVSSEKHGVTWNEYIEQSYPNVPTLFEIARQAGFSTAMATGKMKFIVFTKPGALDDYYYPHEEPVTDEAVAVHAAALLRKHRPRVMFIHFPGVDTVGHEFGWGSPQQLVAIEKSDAAVGRVLAALTSLNLSNATLVILTSDHGGAAKGHEINDPRSHFIPWIVAGPGVPKGFDLTLLGDRTIRIEDTFATACAFLGLAPGVQCDGKAILKTLEEIDIAD